MDWLSAHDYTITRLVIERSLAFVYVLAFVAALTQFAALLGERGFEPAPAFMKATPFRRAPSLFYLHYSDRALRLVSWLGIVLSAAMVLGIPEAGPLPVPIAVWLIVWVLYLSIVNVGQTFYGFGWESLLLEAGALAVFLGNDSVATPTPVLFLFRWLAFRLEFGAGLIKLRGDRCWRDLTCMDYHHETQPMPNPLSWYFHRLPKRLHRMELLGNFVAQLVMPFGLFLPQPVAAVAALVMIVTQGYLVVSGNYAWLNVLTMIVAASGLPDQVLRVVLPFGYLVATPPEWFAAIVVAFTAAVAVLSYWPARNLVSGRQLMNYAFNPLHLVNTYGAFGSVTRERYEVVVEGTGDAELGPGTTWREYAFKGKPGEPTRRPPQVAPYHLRLDWLMWFAALSPAYAESWFYPFVERLLENDRQTLGLLRLNPFPDSPPTYVRARFYRYRFTTWSERRSTGAIWTRQLIGDYLPPVRLRPSHVRSEVAAEDRVP